ncbi:MAG TPA: hypothetical protein VG734_17675 [Lacunisphaera sp.]|nr:hypothetical protein [Lacunisphaera sp.]
MSFWQRLLRLAPYHTAFLGSTNHAWLALVTIGVGIAVATPLAVVAGIAAYGLGVIFLPDLAVFRKGVDEKRRVELEAQQVAESSSKARVRLALLKKLSPKARERSQNFSTLCTELQAKLAESSSENLMPDSSLTKVADSHLLLLAMDADIRGYLGTAEKPAELTQRMETVRAEIAKLKKRPSLSAVEQRLLLSREETLKNLEQQGEQAQRMQLNLELAQSELQRLESQMNSLRAELISTPASQLSNRLGDTLVQVEASQRVLQEGGMMSAPDLNTLLGEHA